MQDVEVEVTVRVGPLGQSPTTVVTQVFREVAGAPSRLFDAYESALWKASTSVHAALEAAIAERARD